MTPSSSRRSVLALVGAAATGLAWPLSAQARNKAAPVTGRRQVGLLTVETVDLSPQFLAFWRAAQAAPDAEARWALWQTHYGFAAVPPTPQGQQMARAGLERVWPRYADAIPAAEAGLVGKGEAPFQTLEAVARLLALDTPATIQLTGFIGMFEGNAFAFRGRYPTLNLPLETEDDRLRLQAAHEGTHVIQMTLNSAGGGWVRSVATTILQEGLAMHASQRVVPGLADEAYVSGRPGWWAEAQARRAEILAGVTPYLADATSEAVSRFTFGPGTTGLNREAYALGWWTVGRLLDEGRSLSELARLPEAEHAALIGEAIRRMQV